MNGPLDGAWPADLGDGGAPAFNTRIISLYSSSLFFLSAHSPDLGRQRRDRASVRQRRRRDRAFVSGGGLRRVAHGARRRQGGVRGASQSHHSTGEI